VTRVAVVANPTKSGDPYWSRRLLGVLERAGLPDARWLPKTAEDPGPGQARRALADGVELVVVAGGDGTVRSVGTVLAGTGVPMALLPSGTGNLLARNLRIPLEVEAAARVATSGRTVGLDVGRAEDGECFLVMAGTGFDAAMLRDTSDRAKVWISWAAYVVAGLRHLRGPLARTTWSSTAWLCGGRDAACSWATWPSCRAGSSCCSAPDPTTGCSTSRCGSSRGAAGAGALQLVSCDPPPRNNLPWSTATSP
jgi:hypothetical protein